MNTKKRKELKFEEGSRNVFTDLALEQWQVREIKQAVREADKSDFASDNDVQNVMNKWTNKKVNRGGLN